MKDAARLADRYILPDGSSPTAEGTVSFPEPRRVFSKEEIADNLAAIFAFFAFMPEGTLWGGRSREEVIQSLEIMLMLPPGGAAEMMAIMRGGRS